MPAPLAIGLLPKVLPAVGGIIRGIFGGKKKNKVSPSIPIAPAITGAGLLQGLRAALPAKSPSIPIQGMTQENSLVGGSVDFGTQSKNNTLLIVLVGVVAVVVAFFAFFRKRRR